jgi:hypothetical protein
MNVMERWQDGKACRKNGKFHITAYFPLSLGVKRLRREADHSPPVPRSKE